MSDPHKSPDDPPTMHDVDAPGQIIVVWAVVLGLAAANILLSMSGGLKHLALPVQLGIGAVQATLVAYYWMHLKRGDQVVTLTAISPLFFMFIFYVLVFADVLTRKMAAY
jgi:cytochrome c oxidase subunit 4